MIVRLRDTDTRKISKQLIALREDGGEVTTGRVLTFVVLANASDDLEKIVAATNDASREHPSRVIVVITGADDATADEDRSASLDAEIRVGGDAGASEVIIMVLRGELEEHVAQVITPLLLPDTPIVAWWPSHPPAVPAEDPVGRLAQRRITDSTVEDNAESIYRRRTSYQPGDSDLAWSRITLWRGVFAAALDQPPHDEITGAMVSGAANYPSVDLAAGWLADRLGMNVVRDVIAEDKLPEDEAKRVGIVKAVLHRPKGDVTVEVVSAHSVRVSGADGRNSNLVALSRRSTADCLAEELRHLDADLAYAKALRGLTKVRRTDAYSAPSSTNDEESQR